MDLGASLPVTTLWADALARVRLSIVCAPSIDPAKAMSGIGFLEARALFRGGDFVKGAGSAASIWSAGAIGLICGMGFLWLDGLVALGVVLLSRRFVDTHAYAASLGGGDEDQADR